MEFATAAHKACYEKVAGYLKDLFGEFAHPIDDRPMFALSMGSAFVQVAVFPWRDDDAVVSARSYVVTGAEYTAELGKFLLEKNDDMRFGAFGLDDSGDIFFHHAIVGSSCDKNELRTTVMAVIQTADDMDDKIVSRWGGKRASDH
jgi:hypothetical protein